MSSGEPSSNQNFPRRARASLRQATLVLPKTGERVHRNFTLSATPSDDESTPLLRRARPLLRERSATVAELARDYSQRAWKAVKSPAGRAIFKCSIAYAISSLATFVPSLSDLLGHNDGKHVVATVSVYFHSHRSAGSMFEATLLAFGACLFTTVISFTSMAVSIFFDSQHLLVAGHVIVLVVFCGGALGLIGWTKQKMGNPLVNVACSLASLTLTGVLTREGSVQLAKFSYDKIFQVLKTVLMGVIISATVSFTIWPRSARKELREDFIKVTDLLEEILTSITRGFLSGSEYDLNNGTVKAAQNGYQSAFTSLVKNLRESRVEHYILGTAHEHELEIKLVKCIERLAQSLFGLRSAASTQFELLEKEEHGQISGIMTPDSEMFKSPSRTDHLPHGILGLNAIAELPETPELLSEQDHGLLTESHRQLAATGPADIFSMFISQLGPPMKSLTFTLKGVLHELPFGPAPKFDITFNENFRTSLENAKDLYISARKDALDYLYSERVWARNRSPEVAADYEEVAASCGQFSSSLEDFAEDTIVYLEILEELKEQLLSPHRRSWSWLLFWKRRSAEATALQQDEELLLASERVTSGIQSGVASTKISPALSPLRKVREQKVAKNRNYQLLSVKVWNALAPLRRDDIKYAIKVGTGGMLYAMFSFIPATRPTYLHWRGEWGLLSYMLVCSMTIGASNTTGIQRFLGTCMGAAFAILFWILAAENPFALGFFGWLMSLGCFYIILVQGKGPMGRFILLTYNLSALYAYSLSIKDGEDDDDEGGISPEIWEIVLHRVVSVMVGCLWGILVTRVIWPISARRKVRDGIALLWLRMGLIWKRDPLQILIDGPARSTYMDIRESIELQRYLNHLEALRASASHEFDLRGPFPDAHYRKILEATARMLGAYHAMSVVIQKDLKASPGETHLLQMTREERMQLSSRISHLFSVLASSMKLEYPMNDSLPSIEHSRDRFLSKLFASRKQDGSSHSTASDDDYQILYAYGLVTGQIASEIEEIFASIEKLYGVLIEDSLKLR